MADDNKTFSPSNTIPSVPPTTTVERTSPSASSTATRSTTPNLDSTAQAKEKPKPLSTAEEKAKKIAERRALVQQKLALANEQHALLVAKAENLALRNQNKQARAKLEANNQPSTYRSYIDAQRPPNNGNNNPIERTASELLHTEMSQVTGGLRNIRNASSPLPTSLKSEHPQPPYDESLIRELPVPKSTTNNTTGDLNYERKANLDRERSASTSPQTSPPLANAAPTRKLWQYSPT